ncbi:MAG: CPBP family intramembrane metalloprotease [Opitutaceae bacterium]|nr:CPBP family intramembrane metalloprotease [Opitutaceae bacterium]
MTDNPLLLVVMIAAAGYLGKLWWGDLRQARAGSPNPQALPGATPAPRSALLIAVAGSLVLLGGETIGEYALGITGEQSTITVLFAFHTLGAAIIEELIFRGYLVLDKRGPGLRWLGVVGASAIFALLHPFLWSAEGGFHPTLTVKGAFSTSAAFMFSLWFYYTRFARWNPRQSLLPCVAGHAAKNLGVIMIKAAQGFLVGWW